METLAHIAHKYDSRGISFPLIAMWHLANGFVFKGQNSLLILRHFNPDKPYDTTPDEHRAIFVEYMTHENPGKLEILKYIQATPELYGKDFYFTRGFRGEVKMKKLSYDWVIKYFNMEV